MDTTNYSSVSDVSDAIRALQSALDDYDRVDAEYQARLGEFERENAGLIEDRKVGKKTVNDADERARGLILALYQADPQAYAALGDPAIKVALHNVAEYDEAALFRAALERAGFLLMVNDKMLQDMAKGGLPERDYTIQRLAVVLPELQFVKRPFVQISNDKLIERVRTEGA